VITVVYCRVDLFVYKLNACESPYYLVLVSIV